MHPEGYSLSHTKENISHTSYTAAVLLGAAHASDELEAFLFVVWESGLEENGVDAILGVE